MSQRRVVIIGAGAAGVYTAYRLKQQDPAADVVLLDRSGRVGGNAWSTTLQVDGRDYSIDLGAQFFHRYPQPGYVQLLTDLGLFEAPAQVDARATGITLWQRGQAAPLLWLPARLAGFRRYRAADWKRLIDFSTFLAYAFLLDRAKPADWTLSVDQWIDGLTLLDNEFKDTVLRPFLFQFVTLPHARIGEASARYAITYFVRNVFGEPGVTEPRPPIDAAKDATFEVYQSRIGLDGILDRALAVSGVIPRLSEQVVAVQKNLAGGLDVATVRETIPADDVVFATDPQSAAAMLEAGAFPAGELSDRLNNCEYADLAISLQQGGACWMPDDPDYWEPINTLVDGDALQFTAWFGPLRDADSAGHPIPVFKSWGAPDLDPAACAETFFSHSHRILAPTTAFMEHRQQIQARQGHDGLWFAGGWTNWFDSQEAALDSATEIAARLSGNATAVASTDPGIVADNDRARQAIDNWLTRVAAHAPAALQTSIASRLRIVESAG